MVQLTFDEAEDALVLGKREKWKRIIIVTDEFHTRRAHLAFQKVFDGSEIEVQVAGALMRCLPLMTGGSQTGESLPTWERRSNFPSIGCGPRAKARKE